VSPCRTKNAKEQRHNPSFDKQATQCLLRHKPDFKWCCQWIVDDDEARKSLLKNSYVLGPEKKPYIAIVAPKFHDGNEVVFCLTHCLCDQLSACVFCQYPLSISVSVSVSVMSLYLALTYSVCLVCLSFPSV
jgi:hypothetical protein